MKRCICIFLVLLLLSGCVSQSPQVQDTLFAMDTVMTLQIWGTDAQAASAQLRALLQDLERTWSATEEASLLSQLNRGKGTPDAQQQALLDRAEELRSQTGGAFDPQLLRVSQAWGFHSKDYRVPSAQELAEALQTPMWDLGGILKGYAGEEAVAILETLQVDRAVLSLGGNVQTYGQKPDGNPWYIAIQNPAGGDPIGQVAVTGTAAVVTSGDYQRYFEQDGRRYHHILDPETGCPADSGLASVTVICASGTRADALSTALFVMGLEEAREFWRAQGDFEAVFVLQDGSILATEGAGFSGGEFEVIANEN